MNAVDALLDKLANVTDIQRALAEHHLTPALAIRMLRSSRGKRQIKALRQLAKIHSELVAHRFSPYAVHKLCQLLSDDKSELRLKGALSILAISGLDGKQPSSSKKRSTSAPADEPLMQTPEDIEVLGAVAEVLAKRREAAEGQCGVVE